MTARSKTAIKAFFETGDKPTQTQFGDLIDSYQDANDTITAIASVVSTGTGLLKVASASAASMIPIGAFGEAFIAEAAAASARTSLGLGTAATKDSGTASGNVPVFNASGGLTGLVESISGHIITPATATYVLDEKAPFAYTINSLVIKASAGTATVQVTVDGSAATGLSAVPVSATQTSANATGGNTVAAGGRVALVFTALTSAPDTTFSLKTTR